MPLDVISSGGTPEEARTALDEAVRLFVRTSAEQGPLPEILREAGYEEQGGDWVNPPGTAIERHSVAVPV